jgi:hypothetical protein
VRPARAGFGPHLNSALWSRSGRTLLGRPARPIAAGIGREEVLDAGARTQGCTSATSAASSGWAHCSWRSRAKSAGPTVAQLAIERDSPRGWKVRCITLGTGPRFRSASSAGRSHIAAIIGWPLRLICSRSQPASTATAGNGS